MPTFRQLFATILSVALLASTLPVEARSAPSPPQGNGQAPQPSAPSDQEIQQMVAPIALYPDALVAQILAAATYPTQVVEADRWLQQNKNLKPDQLAAAVDKQQWDPSVKALTQFPSVLDNMSQNLTWTSNLGDVYYNDQQRVMNAVQIMRKEAQQAGNLKSTPQQTVSTQGQTIVIQPASPTVVYVPTYPPTVYGAPVASPPGYSGWDVAAAAMLSFGVGMMVGAAIRGPSYGWGWGAWGCNWHGGTVVYNRNVYVSRSNTFVNRGNYYNRNVNVNNVNRNNINTNNINRNNVNRNNINTNNVNRNDVNRNNLNQNNVNRNNANRGNYTAANRGYGQANAASSGARSGAFGGYNQGGAARGPRAREEGRASAGAEGVGGDGLDRAPNPDVRPRPWTLEGTKMRTLINMSGSAIVQPVQAPIRFLAVLSLTLGLLAGLAVAQQSGEQTFASPGEAVEAMITAAKAGDTDALMHVFGPDAKQVISSGDPVADKNTRERDVARYDEMHRLVKEPDGTVTLYMGAENWPFPIPLVQKDNAWYFDTAAGKEEILFRRIGRNELATIDTCRAVADAQKQYASEPHDGEPAGEYALKLASDPGKHNGLYWKAPAGEPQSPIGPLIVQAMSEGYGGKGPKPFHGYIYKRLEAQGPDAPGGAKEFVVDGKKTGGFAFLAYPAEYRNSGVMTFIVNQDGIVYQKDLGPDTANTAKSLTEFNPDKSWQPVQD